MLGLERPRQSSGYTDVHRLCHHHFECGLTSSLGPYAGQYDSDLRAIDLCHVGWAGGPSGATESTHPAPQRELSIDGECDENSHGLLQFPQGRTTAPCGTNASPSRRNKPSRRVRPRSEEHTSELQSRGHLVCRLLLEKKKKTHITIH